MSNNPSADIDINYEETDKLNEPPIIINNLPSGKSFLSGILSGILSIISLYIFCIVMVIMLIIFLFGGITGRVFSTLLIIFILFCSYVMCMI